MKMTSTPEEKQRRRKRIRSHIAKDLVTNPQYRKKVQETDLRKKALKDLTHAELIQLINEQDADNDRN